MRSTNTLLILALLLMLVLPAAAAQTTDLTVIRYGWDNKTVEESQTVNVSWMENSLPVFGDGVTPYLLQGPILNITNYSDPAKWNIAEDTNIDKVNETIRGTRLIDLCNLVGGMHPGDLVRIRASDGFTKTFPYKNVYTPQPRQGPIILAWWTARQGYSYSDGIRLFFGADNSTNPWGLHIFGNQDMKEAFDEDYWSWFGGKDALPSAAQISCKWIAKVEILPAPRALAVPGSSKVPTDIDGDGLCEDINGDGVLDFNDVVLYFNQMDWIADNEPISLFDYNGNGEIDFNDVVWLFTRV
ncbi:hypothetical protein [Methanosphaerula palustris]|uniref:Dockerin domain-containing protein n=1 Tax=Methanosphaerula palustris (strain ATCC BAA-1556 / DSM 19958 / E1-9c) TaxID=521011 RepID=B8GG26_METPE|nr:hypothetical protein [Methanosphaerula palustris]ACL16100.1 conserved hypothetical protein [Methanosphaerula palustris E1-9c]